jgi:hypothetical protein
MALAAEGKFNEIERHFSAPSFVPKEISRCQSEPPVGTDASTTTEIRFCDIQSHSNNLPQTMPSELSPAGCPIPRPFLRDR